MKLTIQEVLQHQTKLFSKKGPVDTLWQILAEHFYPERADLTVQRNLGNELADYLLDPYPAMVRRDLANAIAGMLRTGDWLKVVPKDEQNVSNASKIWLDDATSTQLQVQKFAGTNFRRATKEADHDFVTFGQPVISIEFNKSARLLRHMTWHLRDCAWWDDENGDVGGMHRRWKPTLRDLVNTFGKSKLGVHGDIADRVKEEPFAEVSCCHVFMPTEMYGDDKLESQYPYVSLYIDIEHEHLMEEVGLFTKMYVVPRFSTVSGSQYAHSPATICGLPSARLTQAVSHTLLEAGERYVAPPLIATQNAVRSDIQVYSNGITWLDDEYDERLGDALRPLTQDKSGYPIGMEIHADIHRALADAFYINKITLPEATPDMTAYEVQERVKEFQRQAKPLLDPLEETYSAAMCEIQFDLLLDNGVFGPKREIPAELLDTDVEFKFTSPIEEAEERGRPQKFSTMVSLAVQAKEVDDTIVANGDFDKAYRDTIEGIGVPQDWLRDEDDVAAHKQQMAQQRAVEQMAEMAEKIPPEALQQ